MALYFQVAFRQTPCVLRALRAAARVVPSVSACRRPPCRPSRGTARTGGVFAEPLARWYSR